MKTVLIWLGTAIWSSTVFAASLETNNSLERISSPEPISAPEHFYQHQAFTTWQGIEPDKWATIWLIKRHLSRDAYFLLVPPNSELPTNAVPFGVPQSELKRGNRQSMFHHLKVASGLSSEVIDALDHIIYDLEVNIWEAPSDPRVQWIETLYRQLQLRYQRDQVPVDCYAIL